MLWLLTGPVRAYLKGKPVDRGKARVGRLLVRPFLQLADIGLRYRWTSTAGGRFDLNFREEIGGHVAVFGSFEPIEMQTLVASVGSGMSAYDVGANVGLFTVPLALKSGPTGKVVAFEPYQANVARLQEHLALNRLSNVEVLALAAGAFDGTAELQIGKDSARPTTAVTRQENHDPRIKVECRRLDTVWDATGRPPIAALKIDVEGAEVAVLLGATRLITTCHPLILVETVDHISEIEQLLGPFGYGYSQPSGFMPWNFLFLAAT